MQKRIFPPQRDPVKGGTTLLIGVIIIIAVAVVLFGGVFAYQYFATKNSPIAGPALSGVEGWKTYTNAQYNFEFRYPSDILTMVNYSHVDFPELINDAVILGKLVRKEDVANFGKNICPAGGVGGFRTCSVEGAPGMVISVSNKSVGERRKSLDENLVSDFSLGKNKGFVYSIGDEWGGINLHVVPVLDALHSLSLNDIYDSADLDQGVGRQLPENLLNQIISTFKFTNK